jgi:hypothetical protein
MRPLQVRKYRIAVQRYQEHAERDARKNSSIAEEVGDLHLSPEQQFHDSPHQQHQQQQNARNPNSRVAGGSPRARRRRTSVAGAAMTLHVKTFSGQTIPVAGNRGRDTVADLKVKVGLEVAAKAATLKLFYKGAPLLDDGVKLVELGIHDGSVLHTVLKPSRKHSWKPLTPQGRSGGGASAGGGGNSFELTTSEAVPEGDEITVPMTNSPLLAARQRSGSNGVGGGAAAASSSSSSSSSSPLDEARLWKISWESLELERKPFAQGGGGMIFRGTYMANKIAAKMVHSAIGSGGDGGGGDDDDRQSIAANREEFDSEVAMLAKLSHPNVLPLYGTSEDPHDGGLYMISEFCSGGDLESYMVSPVFVDDPAEFSRVCLEIMSGMAYLHARNIRRVAWVSRWLVVNIYFLLLLLLLFVRNKYQIDKTMLNSLRL